MQKLGRFIKKSAQLYLLFAIFVLPFAKLVFKSVESKEDIPYAVIFVIIIAIGFYSLFKVLKKIKDKLFLTGNSETFGKARFSEVEEVIKTGLQGAGIVFGKMGRKLITKPPKVEGHSYLDADLIYQSECDRYFLFVRQ